MRDLGDLMWAAAHERANQFGDLTPEPAELSALRSRVRRGRTMRHLREAAVALPVVVAVVAAGWFGIDRMLADPIAPAVSPEPVQPMPEPTEDPQDGLGAELGPLIEEDGLPPYHEMPDGLLARTGPGWVLTSYEPRRYDEAQDLYVSGPTGVFLVDPAGTSYLVSRYDQRAVIRPVQWQAGEQRVQVIVDTVTAGYADERPEQDLMGAWLDLTTGEFSPADVDDVRVPIPRSMPTSPNGDTIAGVETDQGFGTEYLLTLADGARSRLTYVGTPGYCSPVGWLDADRFLALCLDSDRPFGDDGAQSLRESGPALYAVDAMSGSAELVRSIGPDDPLPEPQSGAWVADGVVALVSTEGTPYGCATGVSVWDGSSAEPLAVPTGRGENYFRVAADDGVIYVTSAPGCSGEGAPEVLTAHDRFTGAVVTLAPEPVGVWMAGMAGWVIAR